MPITWTQYWGRVLLLAAAYYSAVRIGLALGTSQTIAVTIWPPSGVALAGLLMGGIRLWPSLLIGALLDIQHYDVPSSSLALMALSKVLEPMAAAWLIQRAGGLNHALNRLRDLLVLLFCGAIIPGVIGATTALLIADAAHNQTTAWQDAAMWWLGNSLGVILITPCLLSWQAPLKLQWTRQRQIECFTGFALLTGFAFVFLGEHLPGEILRYLAAYLLLLILLWFGLRFNQRMVSTAMLVVFAVTTFYLLQQVGPFVKKSELVTQVLSGVWLGLMAMSGLFVGAVTGERQAAEDSLRSSESMKSALLNALPDSTLRLDINGVFLEGTQLRQKFFDRTAGELIGHSLEEILPPELAKEFRRQMQNAFTDDSGVIVEYSTGKQEAREYFEARLVKYEADHVLGLIRDVTRQTQAELKRRESETLYQSAIEAVNCVPYLREYQSEKFTLMGSGIYALTGYTAKEMTPQLWAELCQESYMRGEAEGMPQEEALQLAREGKLRHWQNDCRIITKSGQARWVFDGSVEILNEDGVPIGSIGVLQDITDRKAWEEERLRYERKLLDTQKLDSLGIMAGGIAHDFNNLLTTIMGNASLAVMEAGNRPELISFLKNIEATSMQAAELCKQMLAYAGRNLMRFTPLDMRRAVQELQSALQISISPKHRLRLDLGTEPLMVSGDSLQLRQVIVHLVVNAAEAIGETNGDITVTLKREWLTKAELIDTRGTPNLPPGEFVSLSIKDTGCGMSPAIKARIFDPFFSTKFTGRGLGLASVLGIVRGHGGVLRVHSQPGVGSNFTLLLPFSKEMSPGQSAINLSPDTGWRGSGTVLIAEDETEVREVLTRIVTDMGFKVLQALDGQQAIDLMKSHPHLVRIAILDHTLPGMNGEETARVLHRFRPELPIIIASGFDATVASEKTLARGVIGILQKPFHPDRLRELLFRAIAWSNGQTNTH